MNRTWVLARYPRLGFNDCASPKISALVPPFSPFSHQFLLGGEDRGLAVTMQRRQSLVSNSAHIASNIRNESRPKEQLSRLSLSYPRWAQPKQRVFLLLSSSSYLIHQPQDSQDTSDDASSAFRSSSMAIRIQSQSSGDQNRALYFTRSERACH